MNDLKAANAKLAYPLTSRLAYDMLCGGPARLVKRVERKGRLSHVVHCRLARETAVSIARSVFIM